MKTSIQLVYSGHITKDDITVGTTVLFCKLKYEDVLRNVKNKKYQIIKQERIIKFK